MNLPDCTRVRICFAAAALCALGSVGSPSAAFANDGGIALGGSPGLLKNHPSVRMAREVIRIRVDKDILTADCNFVFTNDGPACTGSTLKQYNHRNNPQNDRVIRRTKV